ncbi:MAG: glutamate--tRNA ligase [Nanoarchaeota archaeon]|nr:glutamate--tRNA ligase [Nanoarchaeota archaeon]|tara:strand:+ start:393 stop:2033 length:1641 start_codon:yes stop_codon:yes gene_type:complete
MKDLILKYTLQNAVRFNGKANPGAIIGKILKSNPNLKSKIKEISKDIIKTVQEVNKLNIEEQKTQLLSLDPKLLEKKVIKKKTLPNLDIKNLVMRFEPSPSGALHIGHAYVLALNYLVCKKNNGKLILRIGDTNPGNIVKEAYELIEEDANWLTDNNIEKVYNQSERLEIYYKYAEKILDLGKAYICICKPESFRSKINNKIACPCRNLEIKEQLKRWDKMHKGYKPGKAVMRIKTNIKHKNPAIRDWPAFRISEKEHLKQGKKYRVWPLMNFSVAIDDHEMNVTASIRAKEHMDNEKRQKYLYDYFKWEQPKNMYVGRINFSDMKVSSTTAQEMIKEGKRSGWDDPRLPFLQALKRRGYKNKAFLKYAEEIGISESDKVTNKKEFFKSINSFNRDIIDPKADRYFIILEPYKKMKIKKAPKKNIQLDLYPSVRLGGRKFYTNGEFYFEEKFKKDKIYRLMHLYNIKNREFISEKIDDRLSAKMIHWIPSDKNVKIEVLMENNKLKKGLAEESIKKVKEGEIIQAERFSFLKLENREKMRFIYIHR